jgi:hypothetical protein
MSVQHLTIIKLRHATRCRRTSPASGPLLVNHELVGATEEDLGRQVPTKLATEGALDGDGLKGEFTDAGWNVVAASLACHHEGLPISGHLEHASMIGK